LNKVVCIFNKNRKNPRPDLYFLFNSNKVLTKGALINLNGVIKMNILTKLSSQMGGKTEEGNRNVAKECLDNPTLLNEIGDSLTGKNAALLGDCAEVFTKVAEENPILVVPFAERLEGLLDHKTTRVRWEAMHAIALMAIHIPKQISNLLPQLKEIIHNDKSTIVRDYAIDTVCHYANVGKPEADVAFPLLEETLHLWDGKHRARVLNGLQNVSNQSPEHTLEIRGIAEEYLEDNRGVVKKAAKALIKAIDKGK
jgi:hypothetical protein